MSDRMLSSHLSGHFYKVVGSKLGQENHSTVLEKAGLSSDRSNPSRWESLNGSTATETYIRLQNMVS